MSNLSANTYQGMLPVFPLDGHIGYYPVCNAAEWEALPDLYKVMEWEPIEDPHDNRRQKAVKSVIFDVYYIEPYGISAKVSVHPQDVQKILFCNYDKTDCHLYSVCGIELEGGTKLPARWLQDSTSGAFAIVSNSRYAGMQGGFAGYIPEHIKTLEDGTFKYDFKYGIGKTSFYALTNPFKNSQPHKEKTSLDDTIAVARDFSEAKKPKDAEKQIENER